MNILYTTCFLDVSGVTKINLDILKGISGEFTIHVCETESDERIASSWVSHFAKEFGEPFNLWEIPAASRYTSFVEQLKRNRIDIVYITHSLWVYEHAARLKRDMPEIRIVDSLHVLEPYCFRGGYPDISANTFVHPYIDRSIVISDHLLSYIKGNYAVDSGKYVVIRNGIDTTLFKRDKSVEGVFRREIGIPLDIPLIGFIGRFAEQKRPMLFLEVAKVVLSRVDTAYFYMLGSGELVEKAKRVAARLGIADRVIFLPPRDDIHIVLNSTDLLLVTSSYEGAPLTILEALATGVPVVSSDVGAIGEYIGTDCLIALSGRKREADLFAKAIVSQLKCSNPPEFDRERYSISTLVDQYKSVFQNV
jgi:glycosyltransferase involved in cell wall biosynthesis